jgi:glucokinase
MDIARGLILNPGNLPVWHNAPARDLLSQACNGLPVTFSNDANAAAFGEYWVGAGREASSLLLLTLGTGVGGGIIVGGRCIEGAHSAAAEVGHICIDRRPDARLCPCGKRGHLEAYASARSVAERTRESIDAGSPSSLKRAIDDGQPLNGLLIYQHAQNGDSLAQRAILETADYIAWGVADLVHVIDPERVILGGAMNFGGMQSPLGRQFIERIERGVRRLVFPVICQSFQIVYSQLGSDAGWVGGIGSPGGSSDIFGAVMGHVGTGLPLHSQFLHHRPYRSWQEHACGSVDGIHRHR